MTTRKPSPPSSAPRSHSCACGRIDEASGYEWPPDGSHHPEGCPRPPLVQGEERDFAFMRRVLTTTDPRSRNEVEREAVECGAALALDEIESLRAELRRERAAREAAEKEQAEDEAAHIAHETELRTRMAAAEQRLRKVEAEIETLRAREKKD